MNRLVACLLLLLLSPGLSFAQSGKLVNLIPGLYGGDGIVLATAPTASHTAHFSIASAASINQLNQQIASEVGSFPFSSSVGGFSFEFDPTIGDFVSTSKTLGPLVAERASTLGKGRFNLNAAYTLFEYSKFSGQDLNHFDVTAKHDTDVVGFPDTREQFENDIIRIEMDLNIRLRAISISGTYGLLDRLDVGFLLPYASSRVDVRTTASVVESGENTLFPGIHTFDPAVEASESRASGSASGLGNIILRSKYQMLKSETIDLSGAVLVQFGTGDQEDFLGTGDTTIRPFLVASRTFGNFTPHASFGYEFNRDRDDHSAIEYGLGFDVGNNRITVAGELIGSSESDGDGIGDDIVDTSWGVKWNPFQKALVGLNVQLPVNDSGLRSTIVTTLSFEYGF
jgi:hypothetical protein